MKIFAAVARRPDISRQEFHDHWRHPHGTLGRRIGPLRGYVQSHQIECGLLDTRQHVFDGVGEAWIDSAADLGEFAKDPIYVNHLVADELMFVDRPNLKSLVTQEEMLVLEHSARGIDIADRLWSPSETPLSIKLLQFIETAGPNGWESDADAELGLELGALRHARCKPVPELNPSPPPFLGVRELWWPTRSAFEKGAGASPGAWRDLVNRPVSAVTLLVQAERLL